MKLKQTKKIGDVPVILFISSFWNPLLNTINEVLLEKFGTIDSSDLNIFIVKDDENEILEIIKNSKIRDGEDALL
jgi:predicted Rossmann-fold nucleotide-binding protein